MRIRAALIKAHDHSSNRVVANQHHVVDRGVVGSNSLKIAIKVRKVAVNARQYAATRFGRIDIGVCRYGTETTIARDDGSDTLGKFEFHAGMSEKSTIIMGVCINQARRQMESFSVNVVLCGANFTNHDDLVSLDAYIGGDCFGTRTVEYLSISYSDINHDVVLLIV